MKYKIFKATTITICLFVFLFSAKGAFASTLHLSPGSGTVGVGGTLAVRVTLNTQGEGVNGVSAYLSYPSDKLDVAYVTGAGTFGIEAEKSFGGGAIRISRGSINPVSGNVTVATIGFRGKSLGSATVSFIGGSAAPRASDSSDSLNLAASTGGIYSVVAGQPTGQSGKQEPTEDILGPKVSEVTVSEVTTTTATITWKTDELADSQVEYGLAAEKYFLSATTSELTTDHSMTLDSPLFVPGGEFHFRVIAKDKEDNVSIDNDMVFHLKGYQVMLTILDKNNKPLKQTDVFLHSHEQKATTDENGQVTFSDVTGGKHLVVVAFAGGFSQTEEIVVSDTPEQEFTLTVESPSLLQPLYILAAVTAVIILLLGIIGAVKLARR